MENANSEGFEVTILDMIISDQKKKGQNTAEVKNIKKGYLKKKSVKN